MKDNDKDKMLKSSNETNLESSTVVPKVAKKQSNKTNSNTRTRKSSINNEDTNISPTDDSNESPDNVDNLGSILNEIKSSETENNSANNNEGEETSGSISYGLDLAVLNEISRVCQLAMANISLLAGKISNHQMKQELVAIYSQYSNILLQINQHFEKYGEIPDNVPIRSKLMGACGVKMNTMKDRTNSHIADIMIQGSLMGIIKCQKILNCNLDIEKSTTELLKDFNQFQRENISKLNAYL